MKQLRGNETKLRLEKLSGASATDRPGRLEELLFLLFYLESSVGPLKIILFSKELTHNGIRLKHKP